MTKNNSYINLGDGSRVKLSDLVVVQSKHTM